MADKSVKTTCCCKATEKPVDLGFVEEAESADSLSSYRFPSKVGGRPAWLALKNIPGVENVTCRSCGKPCVLLLQVYCPDDNSSNCFHRSVFVFVCRQSKCYQTDSTKYFRVFRSQLPRNNEFYSDQPPVVQTASGEWEDTDDELFPKRSAADFNKLCVVCGGLGRKTCAKCKVASYCSKEHQKLDWRVHKQECVEGLKGIQDRLSSSALFPEFKLITETEECDVSDEENETEEMKHRKLIGQDELKFMGESFLNEELETMALSESEEDKVFQMFKHKIDRDPDQVLRYQRGGEPLWVSGKNIPSPEDIPTCSCGAKRQFEFQILPQLLNHLNADSLGDSLDWGTLAVYTCAVNCDIGGGYAEEFLWKQNFITDMT